MPTFGLVVEGTYDEAALTVLIRKCIEGDVDVVARPCGPSGALMNKLPGFLEEFRHVRQGTHVDKALVIRDSNDKDPDELMQRMQSNVADRSYPFPLRFVLIVRELETWLLADNAAISEVTQEYSGRIVSAINETLEEIRDPKARLQRILSDARVAYTEEVARKIATAANLNRIEYRCPNFRIFRQAVLDC